jgi:uncharacterized protein with beta-barrel porin domain
MNSEYLSLYGTSLFENFYIEAALWGNLNQIKNKRHVYFPGFDTTSKSHTHSSQFNPHLAIGYDIFYEQGLIEPFLALDLVINWQKGYQEQEGSALNMQIKGQRSWMFRTEFGLNGYYTQRYCWGTFIFQSKLSYIFKNPYNMDLTAAIVGAPGSFNVEMFPRNQHLFSPGFEFYFQGNGNIYGSFGYNSEFGSGYFTNQAAGKIGYYF